MKFVDLFESSGELWHCLEQIGLESDIGDLEDWCVWILVDGDDRLRILHSSQMLNGSRDSDSDVQLLETKNFEKKRRKTNLSPAPQSFQSVQLAYHSAHSLHQQQHEMLRLLLRAYRRARRSA
ncbi:hypothetical protein GCK72_000043 [Caenorhabditis remanei]|uniref:Uncharacterized protein n=1 Tax=Caenorhabditis remanei TaxID=31234 RepID=A0A6A5HM57_CAERE|nr:hypothetical protein GCK72_000043 [Caenorhabditis remanei]KAF1768231.1 hypothetical protein GCK72_000043 [Caenorhabditis remanei]